MSEKGWIKLHRQLLKSNCFQNEKLLKVWIWCLLKATHTGYQQQIGRQLVPLEPGQFPTGRYKAGYELGMNPSTAWNYLLLLKKSGNIDIKSHNKYSVVTVVNWAVYQGEGEELPQQTSQQIDSKLTTNSQQIDTNKNVKNVKNEYNPLTPFETAIEQFKEFRKSIKNPMTDKAVELLLKKLDSLAGDNEQRKIAILEQSILRGWAGVFELKEDFSKCASKYDDVI